MGKRARRGAAEGCPCGSERSYATCCGPLIEGTVLAHDAQALMRSRYSAYALAARDYLLASWHPSTRPAHIDIDPQLRWIGLELGPSRQLDDRRATVAFSARYKLGGRAHRIDECSRFCREDGRWYYLDGDISEG